MRRISIAIVVSLGVHAGAAWALHGYQAAQAVPEATANTTTAEAAPPGELLVTDLEFTVEDPVGDPTAPDSDAAATDGGPDATPAARRDRLREARERAAERRALRLARAAEAHRQAVRARVRLRASELEVDVRAAKLAVQRDQALTTEGKLRIARAPVTALAEAVVAAEAAAARTEQEAKAAEARVEAPPPPPPPARGKAQKPSPPADTPPPQVAMNAAIARANAAKEQAKVAKTNADAARRRHEASAAALEPLAAAAAADAAALQQANAALTRAEQEVVLAAAALHEATARSEREATRALAELQAPVVDPAEWVKLPGATEPPAPPATPRGPVAPAPSVAGADAADAGPTDPASTPRGGEPVPPHVPPIHSPGVDPARPPAAVAASAPGADQALAAPLPGSPAADAFSPLTYVRTEGGAVAAWDPNARVIGTNALAALVAMRAPANVAPLDAIGPGQAPEARFEAPAPRVDRDRPLPPLRSDGPAADGFVLTLLDGPAPAAPPPAVDEPAPGGGETATAPTHAEYEPEADPSLVDASADAVSVLPDSVPEGSATLISVSGHPLAGWMDGVDEALRRGWDYPVELQARGLTGSVEVGFRVSPSGRVSNVKVLRSDAPPELVITATSSVPARVKPPPAGWGDIDIRYTYRYRAGP